MLDTEPFASKAPVFGAVITRISLQVRTSRIFCAAFIFFHGANVPCILFSVLFCPECVGTAKSSNVVAVSLTLLISAHEDCFCCSSAALATAARAPSSVCLYQIFTRVFPGMEHTLCSALCSTFISSAGGEMSFWKSGKCPQVAAANGDI